MANSLRVEARDRRRLEMEINDLAGGFISQAATYNIDTRYLSDIQNMELVQGMWQKRKGYHLSGSFQGIEQKINTNRGLHVFNLQGNLHVLGIYGTAMYDTYQITKSTGGKIISRELPDVQKFRFQDFRNHCYLAHGNDGILKYDGNALTPIDSPPGNIISSFDGRLVLSGIKGDPLALYYSERGRGNVWKPLNYVLIEGGSNERITGMFPLQGKLYIFTNQSIFSLVGSFEEGIAVTKEVEGVGPASQEAIQIFGNRFYFATERGEIFEYDGGGFPKEISLPIQAYLHASFSSNHFRNCATTFYKNSVWFTLDNHPSPDQRVTLVYYPDYQAWTKFVGIPAARYAYVENSLYFTGSHNEGSLYHYGTQYKDDTRGIEGYLKTVKYDFNRLENRKRFKELYLRGAIQGGAGSGFDLTFYIDGAKASPIHIAAQMASLDQLWNQKIPEPTQEAIATDIAAFTQLEAGTYQIAYTWKNDAGESSLSPITSVTIDAGDQIEVDVPPFPDGVEQVYLYMSDAAGSPTLKFAKSSSSNLNIVLDTLPASTASSPPTESTINAEKNRWGKMYWGFAAESSGTKWGEAQWDYFKWNGSTIERKPKWGYSVWNSFKWGSDRPDQSPLLDDVGTVYQKLYLSQYNIISGKTIEIEMRDNTPGHGFRFENLTLMYIQKGAR